MSGQKPVIRYSLAFKQKVVSEIESGKYSILQARKIYAIGGGNTIYGWLRKLGQGHLIEKTIRVEMRDEKDKLKALEKKNRELESALANAHLKLICFESLLECVEEHYQVDVKKTFGRAVSKERSSKSKQKR